MTTNSMKSGNKGIMDNILCPSVFIIMGTLQKMSS